MFLKIIASISITLTCLNLSGQDKSIYVEYTNKLIAKQETTGVLIANKNHAIYLEHPSSKKGEMAVGENPDGGGAVIYKPDLKESSYFKTKGTSLIYYTEYLVKDSIPYYVFDSIPKLKWEFIPNQFDTIQGYVCNKAKLTFRGSKLTAYYTTKIPFSFGPWKFDGLPGLILRISEDEYPQKIFWEATSIVYPYKNLSPILPKKEKYVQSLKDFKIMSYKIYEEKGKVVQKKIIEDAEKNKLQMTLGQRPKIQKRPTTVEKVYEWEQEGDIWFFYIDYFKKHPEYKINNL